MALSRQNTDSSAAANRLNFFMVQFLSIVYRCLPTPPKQGWALCRFCRGLSHKAKEWRHLSFHSPPNMVQ